MSVQLHTHSDYSLLRSTLTVERLVRRAQELGFQSLALTDYNTMAGHVEFDRLCRKSAIKPIFGIELEVFYPPEFSNLGRGNSSPLVLLAAQQRGYTNLLRLASHNPPLPLQTLAAFKEGLLLLEGGLNAQISLLASVSLLKKAQALHAWYEKVFGRDFYLRYEPPRGAFLFDLFAADRFVLSQDVRYAAEAEKEALRVLAKIGKLPLTIPDLPFLSWQELVAQAPAEIIENTLQVAEKCQARIPQKQSLPAFPKGEKDFAGRVWAGASLRYPQLTPAIRRRIEQEIAVIEKMGFADYFLIVAEIAQFAKNAHIPVGPGRGSAASSIVAYCLGITAVDPLAWGLLFERFLNLERASRPDIDLDFCYERRGEVLAYVAERFGPERVAQIGTYGTFGKRSARQEVKRALGQKATEQEWLNTLSGQIQGLKRQRATHAAGLVITEEPTQTITAVYQDRNLPVTHLDMYSLEELGVLKIDLLGLRTLTILARMEKAIKEKDPHFSLGQIPPADQKAFQMLAEGKSLGVFQLESPLFQEMLLALKPNSFSDLVALLALGRPGPLALFPQFLRLRKNPEQINYLHPALEEILSETYGLLLYQEQAILIAHKIGGLSLGEADLLRAALGRGEQKAVQSWRQRFLEGAAKFGLTPKAGKQLFQTLRKFSGYAFNKAHSVSYARLTWQSAYVKAHYPLQFFSILLNAGGAGKTRRGYLLDCQQAGIEIYAPSVRFSSGQDIIEGGGLRLGLSSIKGLGPHLVQKILKARRQRPFKNLLDLRRRVQIPADMLEILALAGALDDLENGGLQLQPKPRLHLERLRRQRELIGIFASGHPAHPFLPFLRHIQGAQELCAGEVLELEQKGGKTQGVLDTPQGARPFLLATPLHGESLKRGDPVGFFGKRADAIFLVERIFPLGPIFVILPKKTHLALLAHILKSKPGKRPVILRMGLGIYHVLPRSFWIEASPSLYDTLQQAGIDYQWFDPWKENAT